MSIENSRNNVPSRHHDSLPTIALRKNIKGWTKAYLEFPFWNLRYPRPTVATLEGNDEQGYTAITKLEGGKIGAVRVDRVEEGLKAGQKVILYKEAI